MALLAVLVEDILEASACSGTDMHVKSLVKQIFKIEDMAEAEEFLSIRISLLPGRITVDLA